MLGCLALGSACSITFANPLGGLEQNWGGLFLLVLVAAAVYELIVILVEAAVYTFLLKIRYRRSFGISLVANIASLIVGLAVHSSEAPERFLVALVVELPILFLFVRKDRNGEISIGKILAASFLANLLTHAATLLVLHH